ncbi:thioesterase domain-containing protein [Micromonospora sagamiensis]|uniref:Thioesterase domain-containing protein n=1 Tax=Micromonospora sagamiensis TaxID=47875 RepID=A0A562WH09_9ACTN|nr:alpha/beta fold hydrolase [Micromonospora sagamiensis]TWJ29428.1 thioesterase domain-containing protein [Micromonospora sagamiensis]BCL17542.1 hypothetical protein GCM10017556_52810 [Micromonospora sagamiensis]
MPTEQTTLVPLQPSGDRPPLYCVHPASGSVYCYSGLAGLVGSRQPVFGLEAPGLEGDRPPVGSVAELVEAHLAALPPTAAATPVNLLGWSLGGVVAFELAHRLRAAGARVNALIMVDSPVPRAFQRPPEADILRRFLMETTGGDAVSDEQVTELSRTLAAPAPAGDDDDALELAVLRSRYAVFRANTEALIGHRLTGRYPGAVQLVRADRSPADRMRWTDWAEEVTTHVLPGDHMSIWAGESLTRLAATVAEVLAKADAVGPDGPEPAAV